MQEERLWFFQEVDIKKRIKEQNAQVVVVRKNIACLKHRSVHKRCPQNCPDRYRGEIKVEDDVDIERLIQTFRTFQPPIAKKPFVGMVENRVYWN